MASVDSVPGEAPVVPDAKKLVDLESRIAEHGRKIQKALNRINEIENKIAEVMAALQSQK